MAQPKEFRINASAFFLTYPQCPIPKEKLHELVSAQRVLPAKFHPDMCNIAVAQETHQNGGKHLHAWLRFKPNVSRYHLANPLMFDVTFEGKTYHPSIERQKGSDADVADYVMKEDKNPFLVGWTLPEFEKLASEKKKGKKRKDNATGSDGAANGAPVPMSQCIVDALDAGKTAKQVYQEMPHLRRFFVTHLSAIRQLETFVSHLAEPVSVTGMLRVPKSKSTVREGAWVYNEFSVRPDRAFKTKNLWITGPRNSGKTSMIHTLEAAGVRVYRFPHNNDHWQWANDGRYAACVFDEFVGNVQASILNKWLEGDKMPLNFKNGSTFKTDNPFNIVLSNKPFSDCYPNIHPDLKEALQSRFHFITWEQGFHRCRFIPTVVVDPDATTEPDEPEEPEAKAPAPPPAEDRMDIKHMVQKVAQEDSKMDVDRLMSLAEIIQIVESEEEEPAPKRPKTKRFRSVFIDDEAGGSQTDSE